jgi:DNA-binding PadR family transcriptional regulator
MAETALNATAAALLGLLHDGPKTGGQLVAEATGRLGPFWTTTRSQVYRELPSLAAKGYVRAGKAGARSAQPYTVTATGKRAFSRWLGEPAGHDQLRNPLMLRVAFGGLHGKGQLDEIFAEKKKEHTDSLEAARERLKEAKRDGDKYASATLDFAVTYHRAVLKWLDAAPDA